MENAILSISLKEYKEQINDLKASLLGLEKGSEDYQKTANQVRDMQNKLNEVMAVGKKNTDAASGSYNAIQNQMRELVKANKEMAGGLAENSEAFIENAKKINELNEKLKEADAQMGFFQRNVGDYKNQFMSAFSEMGSSPQGLVVGLTKMGDAITGLTTKYGSFGGAVKAVATAFKTTLKGALDVVIKHPIMAMIALLVTAFMKVKDAIGKNAQATKTWQRAMSAFQPIINLFKNILDKVAVALANVADWIAKKLPSGLRIMGKGISGGIRALNSFVQATLGMASSVAKIWDKTVGMIHKAIGSIAGGIGNLAKKVGLDSLGNSLLLLEHTINNFSAEKMINGIKNGIGGALEGAAEKVDSFFEKIAQGQEDAYNRTVKQQKLNADIAENEREVAESERRQAELRDKIAKASGKERLALLKDLKKEIETTGKKQVELARREYELAKENASLSPTDTEGVRRLRELENNVIKAETQYKASLVSVDKMYTRTENSMSNAAKAAAKERKQLSEQEYKEKLRYHQLSLALVKEQLQYTIKGSAEEYQLKKQELEHEYQLNVAKINKEIKDEAEKLKKLELLRKGYEISLLKLDNDEWERQYQNRINNYKLLLDTFTTQDENYYRVKGNLAASEAQHSLDAWTRQLQQGASNTTGLFDSLWENFQSVFGKDKTRDVRRDIKTLIESVNKETELAVKYKRTVDGNLIYTLLGVDPKNEKEKAAVDQMFTQIIGSAVDAQTYLAMIFSQYQKVRAVTEEYNASVQKSEALQRKIVRTNKELNESYKYTEQYYKDLAEEAYIAFKNIADGGKLTTETEEEFLKRQNEALQTYYTALSNLAENSLNGEKGFNSLSEQEGEQHKLNMLKIAEELLTGELETQEEYNRLIEKEEKRHRKALEKISNAQAKKEAKIWRNRLDYVLDATSAMIDVTNDWAAYKENDINKDLENKKISEELAKKKFEDVKKMQIAATTANMLASLVSINASIWDPKNPMPVWAKIALTATKSAAAYASGRLAIQQIKNTEFGGDGSSSSMGAANAVNFSAVGVNPLLNEQADMANVQNVNVVSDATSKGDQRVYILQSDITDSNKQVKIRQTQSTF